MTATARPGPVSFRAERRANQLVMRAEPGLAERFLVVVVLFLSQFGTPTDWFAPRATIGFTFVQSNPILVYGSLLIVAVLCVGLVGNGEAVWRAIRIEPWLVIFVCVVAASSFWSSNPGQGLSDFANFFVATTLAFVLFVRFRLVEVVQLVTVAFVAGILLHLVWVFGMPSYGRIGGDWVGASINKNFLGSEAVQAIPFFVLGARALPRWRFPLYFLTIASIVLVVGSRSKTALAAGALTAMASVAYMAFRGRRTLFGAVFLTLGFTSITAMLFATANLGLIAQWLDKDVTLTGRSRMWPLIIDSIMERPFLGYGYGGYWGGYLSPAHEVWVSQRWFPTHAHNAALEVALRVGIIGLAVLLVVNVRALVRATRLIQEVPGPLSMLPLIYFTLALMASITESGVLPQRFGWTMFVYSVLVVGHSRRYGRGRSHDGPKPLRPLIQRPSIAPMSGAP